MTRRAFTLMELMVAVAIMAVIAVSIYASFGAGIKAWHKGDESRELQKIRTALLRIQKELRGSFFFSEAPFRGFSSSVMFPIVAAGEDKDKIYIITYYITEDKNTGSKALMKTKNIFTGAEWTGEEGTEEFVFFADSIDFEYAYGSNDGSKGIKWKDEWGYPQEKLPLAVKINFKTDLDEGIYHKIIFIPQGALGAE